MTPTELLGLNPNLVVRDVWGLIFSNLSLDDLKRAARVCRLFKSIVYSGWPKHCRELFSASLFPKRTDWKGVAYPYLFLANHFHCFITPYANNRLNIQIDPDGVRPDRINDIYLLVYPTEKIEPLIVFRELNKKKCVVGAAASAEHTSLIFFAEYTFRTLNAFFKALTKSEAKGSKPSIAPRAVVEAA